MAGNLEGTVPARVRRTEFDAEREPGLLPVSWPASKSGKLSLLGDSGMVSLSGVECPLPVVGGPQICGDSPSCAWISRALPYISIAPVRPFPHDLPLGEQATSVFFGWRACSSSSSARLVAVVP